MKKIINILLVLLTLITSINPIYAYNKVDHERDQGYVLKEKRLIYEMNNFAKVGDYVKHDIESLRMYYDRCGYNLLDCLGAFFMNVYDLNSYENREIVVEESRKDIKEITVNIPATYKDIPIKEKVKVYGKYFEINFFQVTFYAILGYDIKINDVIETKRVFDLLKFKYVTKQVTVKEYYAAKVTTKEVIVGYKKVVDVPAHTKKAKVCYEVPPRTLKYKAFLNNQSFGVGGYAYAAGEGLKSTIEFGGEIITAIKDLDADKITFIKDGREYFATVIDRSTSAKDVYSLLISDTYNTVTTSVTVTVKYYLNNPDQINELMGTISYAIAIGKFADIGLAKLNSSIPVKINIDDDIIRLYTKFNDKLISPLIKYGDDLVQMTSKFGDDVVGLIDDADSVMVKSIVDNIDDFDNLDEMLKAIDEVKDTTGKISAPTFKSSYDIPVDAATGETRSNLKLGPKVHSEYKVNDKLKDVRMKEFVIPGTRKRIDFIDVEKGIVYELKPNNRKSIALGEKQAKKYIELLKEYGEIDSDFAKDWKFVIDTY